MTTTTTSNPLAAFPRFAGGVLPESGVYPDIPRTEYDRWPAISQSLIKRALISPAHARATLDGLDKQTEAQRFGSAYHTFLLEPDRFEAEMVIWSGLPRNRKEGKSDWESAVETAGGDESRCISRDDLAIFEAMRARLRDKARANALLRVKGLVEVSVVWNDSATGLPCKARLDKALPGTIALDVKKTRTAHPQRFGQQAAIYGYHTQGAYYVDGLAAAGAPGTAYTIIAQEDEQPYAASIFEVGPDELAAGRGMYRMGLAALAASMHTGNWPDYGNEVHPLVLPKWAYQQSAFVGEADASPADAEMPWQTA